MERRSRHKLRVGHVFLRHRLVFPHQTAPAFLFTIAQGHLSPCTWAHAFAILPGHPQPFSRHFNFDTPEITIFRQRHPDHSLDWLDSQFMLQLALDQVLRLIPDWLPYPADSLPFPERIDLPTLMLHHLNGDFPQLEAMLAICGEFYLFHQELQALQAFPRLHSR